MRLWVSPRAARRRGLGRWLREETPQAAQGQRDPGVEGSLSDWVQWEGPSHEHLARNWGSRTQGEFLGTPAHTPAGFIGRPFLSVSL